MCAPVVWLCNVHECFWMCTNLCLNVHQCVWMCTNVSECACQWEPSRVQVGTQRQGPEDRFSQNAAAGCLINSAQHTIVKHTNFGFVRTKCFPLWKVNTTIPANRHHRISCKANEWCFYSSLVNLVVEWYFMTEYVGLWCAPNSIWDNQLFLKEAIAFFSEGVRAWAWDGRRGDGIHRCWKSDERERERWSDEAWELTSGPPSSQLGGQWHQDYYQYQTTYARVQKVIICDDLMAHENVFTWTSPNRKSYFPDWYMHLFCLCVFCIVDKMLQLAQIE